MYQASDFRRPAAPKPTPAAPQGVPFAGRPVGVASANTPQAANPRLAQSIAATLDVTFQKLEEAIEQETAALRAGGRVNLDAFNARKSQALLELTRMLRQLKDAQGNEGLAKRMASLQSKLAVNSAVLKMHLEAVREISTTLADAIREAESDGTYSPRIYGGARRQ